MIKSYVGLVIFKEGPHFAQSGFAGRKEKMANEKETCCDRKGKMGGAGAAGGGIYGLAFIGALVYLIEHADTFWIGVLGFFKALLWPAFLIYKLLEFLNM